MPLLSILVVLLAVQAVPWPEPLVGGAWWHIVLNTLLVTAIPVLFMANVSVNVVKGLRREPYRRGTAARRLERGRIVGFILNLGSFAVSVGVVGWGWLIWQMGAPEKLFPFAELLVPLPMILVTMLSWLVTYPAERAIFNSAPMPPPVPFFSPLAYLWFKFRFYSLFILFPATLAASQQSLSRFFPAFAEHPLTAALGIIGILGLFVFMPLAVPYVFGWVRMRDDAVRERLEQLAKRARFRFRELYVWPTRGSVANALVLGLIPQARFVVFTDKLLDTLNADELDSVFGHEIGHVHHKHIPYYALFLVLSGCAVTAAVTAVLEYLKGYGIVIPEESQGWIVPIPIVALGVYLFLAFGFLSRRCERQADLFGSKAVSCDNPKCDGHDEKTVFPDPIGNLCPTGLRTFTTALDRVVGADAERPTGLALLWAMIRSWQHGPPGDRIDYLQSLIEKPEQEPRFQRRVFILRIAIVVGLTAITTGLVWYVGWRQVLSGI